MRIEDIKLIQTCGACPEQYDALIGHSLVGYLRLRHGYFYVQYPHCGGKLVFEAYPEGDGIFEDHERERFLTAAKEAILKEYLTTHLPMTGEDHDNATWDRMEPDEFIERGGFWRARALAAEKALKEKTGAVWVKGQYD